MFQGNKVTRGRDASERERRKTDKEHVAKSELGEEEAAAVACADVRYNVKG